MVPVIFFTVGGLEHKHIKSYLLKDLKLKKNKNKKNEKYRTNTIILIVTMHPNHFIKNIYVRQLGSLFILFISN